MHSRIFEISRTPVEESRRFSSSNVPDNFYNSVADYTDDDVDREDDIKWLFSALKGIVTIHKDGESFTFKEGYKQNYFRKKHSEFVMKAAELSGVSLDAFCGENSIYPMEMEMFRLRGLYDEHYEFYIYFEDELITLDYWIRYYNLDGELFIGGIVDYHY